MTADVDALLDDQHPVKQQATEWARANLRPRGQGRVDAELWNAAGTSGLLGLKTPVELGGTDATATHIALRFEGLGASGADLGEAFALASQSVVANRTLASWGSPEVHEQWFPGLANGSLRAAFAMTEYATGSTPWEMETTARQQGSTWVLNGTKAWITMAPVADVAVIFALTDPERGRWGVSAFAVPIDTPGVQTNQVDKIGLTGSPFGEIVMNDVAVPEHALLGRAGAGAAIFTTVVEFERALLYALEVGAGEHLIAQTIDRARTRNQGGTNIGSYQAVSHRIVDMVLAQQSARALLYRATLAMDSDRNATVAAALAKLSTSSMAIDNSISALRTFGTQGYTSESQLDVRLLDAVGGLSYSGTPDIARNLIASVLGIDRPA